MIWSETPPTKAGTYWIQQIKSGREFGSTLSESGEWDAYDGFWDNGTQLVLFGPPIPTPEVCTEIAKGES